VSILLHVLARSMHICNVENCMTGIYNMSTLTTLIQMRIQQPN